MSGTWQILAYVFRFLSMNDPYNSTFYAIWFVLILVAPLWTNAFVYMVVGRITWNFKDDARVLRIKAWRVGTIFVIFDIITFFVQVYGVLMASGQNKPVDQVLTGKRVTFLYVSPKI